MRDNHRKRSILLPALAFTLIFILMSAMADGALAESNDAATAVEDSVSGTGVQEENGSIRLSNTIFPGMEGLSREETELLMAAEEMLAGAQLEKVTASSYGLRLNIKNTSGADFSRCEVELLLLDRDGKAIHSITETLNGWRNGEAAQMVIDKWGGRIYFNSAMRDNKWTSAQIGLRFQTGSSSSWYRTGFRLIRIEGQEEESGTIRIRPKDPLPVQYTVYAPYYRHNEEDSVYTVSDFEQLPAPYDETYSRFRLLVTKESGPEKAHGTMYFRLVRSDGVVVDNSSIGLNYLRPGDIYCADVTLLLAGFGEYTLEFINGVYN